MNLKIVSAKMPGAHIFGVLLNARVRGNLAAKRVRVTADAAASTRVAGACGPHFPVPNFRRDRALETERGSVLLEPVVDPGCARVQIERMSALMLTRPM
jgi:hypothetical protein